jgi:NADH-quinone oxidoreductase subunit G
MADNDTITIEVDGKPLQARKGQMLIEVTDANDIYIPRFCYHPKLTIAANCRMCLVQVEKAPKPLPACATPVMDGMKVQTRSAYARDAQKAVMEFLLINHPLDCPICDQGGECELQDLAMGYGSDVSRYQEKKRVVKDKNIGPLVQTEMTRCIHCTRCVRFGEEIAGLRELGATGRSEYMEIGTYVEKSMVSELSGNVIDVCPVGALTSKPFRFSARTWEMSQHPGIAPHDGTGSNVHFHVKRDQVKRVVPAQNESINEVWLSDRDRFSYEGMYSADRLTVPMVKENGSWRETDWDTAFRLVSDRISKASGSLGALVSPTATTEEAWLLQKIVRAAGSNNIDHRLHQTDFSDAAHDAVYPSLGQSIPDLEKLDTVLLVCANPRKQQPLLNLRLRKAALRGAEVMVINPVDYDVNYRIGTKLIAQPVALVRELAGVLKAVCEVSGNKLDTGKLLDDVTVTEAHRAMANKLVAGKQSAVLAGNLFTAHPHYATLRYLAGHIAGLTGSTFGYLGESANEAGAWLAGAVPHRGPGAQKLDKPGLNACSMFEQKLSTYLLFNIEPDLDCANAGQVTQGLDGADTVIAFTPYKSASLLQHANVLLPVAVYAENEGSAVNVTGQAQAFSACVAPPGEARPGWKVLRVLANHLMIAGTDYQTIDEIRSELHGVIAGVVQDNRADWGRPAALPTAGNTVYRISELPMNSVDSLVRRAPALQETADVSDAQVRINSSLAASLGLNGSGSVRVEQQGASLELACIVDSRLAANTVLIHGAHPATAALGSWFSEITIRKV